MDVLLTELNRDVDQHMFNRDEKTTGLNRVPAQLPQTSHKNEDAVELQRTPAVPKTLTRIRTAARAPIDEQTRSTGTRTRARQMVQHLGGIPEAPEPKNTQAARIREGCLKGLWD